MSLYGALHTNSCFHVWIVTFRVCGYVVLSGWVAPRQPCRNGTDKPIRDFSLRPPMSLFWDVPRHWLIVSYWRYRKTHPTSKKSRIFLGPANPWRCDRCVKKRRQPTTNSGSARSVNRAQPQRVQSCVRNGWHDQVFKVFSKATSFDPFFNRSSSDLNIHNTRHKREIHKMPNLLGIQNSILKRYRTFLI